MDYGSGTELWYAQWRYMRNPDVIFRPLQGDDKGASKENKYAHLALSPSGNIIDKFFKDGKEIQVTLAIARNYTISTISYDKLEYRWDTAEKAYINGSSRITVEKIDRELNDKVNLFRSRGDGCNYDYLVIPWSGADEKAKDVQAIIAAKLKQLENVEWSLSPYDIKDASCSNGFSQELLAQDRKDCAKIEVDAGIKNLKAAIKLTDAEKIVSAVNSTCMTAIRNLTYTEIEILINTIAELSTLKEQSELAILRLMTAIKTSNYADFYTYLEKENNRILKKLVAEIDDASIYFLTDKNNYTNFIGALVTMFNQAPASLEKRWPTKADDFAARMINLNAVDYSSDTSSAFSPRFTSKVNKGEYSESTGNITLNDVYTTYSYNAFDFNGSGVTKTEHTEKTTAVSPLTPIIIVPNTDKLPLIATALGENSIGNSNYIVPAILLKYQADKIRNDYIEKGVMTTLDLATIYFSGGTALATKVTWVRRAWAMAEVAGAVGNIGVTTQTINPNSNLGKAVTAYNLGMGIIGVKNLAVGGYKFVVALPENTKNFLQQNKGIRDLLLAQYTQWKTLTKNLDNLSPAEKQLVSEQEKVWKALGIVDKLVDVVYRNIKYEDFIKTFTATEDQYKEAYKLWGQEKWDELYQYFKTNKLNDGWPPYNGAKNILKTETGNQLNEKVFDRFQKYEDLSGGFASPVPNNSTYTIQSRALGVNYDEMEELGQSYYYIKFKIKDAFPDLNFEYGEAVPWFNELGGAVQIKSSKNFRDIKSNIEILEKWRFNAGKWEELKLIDGIWK
jgi:hypothetical protein